MINPKEFLKGLHLLKENFEFDISKEYTKMIYDTLKDKLDDKMFIDSCNNILQSTNKEEWNQAYGFKGRPAVKDWLDAFIPSPVVKKRHKICQFTTASLVEEYIDYPDPYLEFLNQQKRGKFEASDRVNKKKVETIIKTITTNN